MLQFSFPTLFGLIFTLLRGLSSDRPCSPYETFGGSALLRLMTITSEGASEAQRKEERDRRNKDAFMSKCSGRPRTNASFASLSVTSDQESLPLRGTSMYDICTKLVG